MWGLMGDPSTNTTYISSERRQSFDMERLFMFGGKFGETTIHHGLPASKSSYPCPLGNTDNQFGGPRQSRCPSFDIVDCIA
jgi:hypothetical protein